jgi:DNA-binding NtrC family response regulator
MDFFSAEHTATLAITPKAATNKPGWQLLLVEDQMSDVFLAEDMLNEGMPDYQWHILNRSSLTGAVTLLQKTKFDLALVDLTLKDTAGTDIVATLRGVAPELPIIVYTGSSDVDLQNAAILAGAQYCIEKNGTNPELMRDMIQCALKTGHFV